MTVEERVQKGAEFLDRVKPGWQNEIDLVHLDIGSCFRCILGQLFGRYSDAIAKIPEIQDVRVRNSMGFTTADDGRNMEEELAQAWTDLIMARINATPSKEI